MAKQNISKKKNTKPILVPLSLDLLLEEGILPTDWPHTDKAFDVSGAWTHSFSTHGSQGCKGDKSSFYGSMRISRRLTWKDATVDGYPECCAHRPHHTDGSLQIYRL